MSILHIYLTQVTPKFYCILIDNLLIMHFILPFFSFKVRHIDEKSRQNKMSGYSVNIAFDS